MTLQFHNVHLFTESICRLSIGVDTNKFFLQGSVLKRLRTYSFTNDHNEQNVLEMPEDLFQHRLAHSKGTVLWMRNKRAQCPQGVRGAKGEPCVLMQEARTQRLGVHSPS